MAYGVHGIGWSWLGFELERPGYGAHRGPKKEKRYDIKAT